VAAGIALGGAAVAGPAATTGAGGASGAGRPSCGEAIGAEAGGGEDAGIEAAGPIGAAVPATGGNASATTLPRGTAWGTSAAGVFSSLPFFRARLAAAMLWGTRIFTRTLAEPCPQSPGPPPRAEIRR